MRRVLVVAAILSVRSALAAAQTAEGISKALEDFEKRFPPVKKNAAADDLERLSLALGLDSKPRDSSADHPTKEDQDAYRQAEVGAWLDAQVRTSDDSITSPPPRLKEFLEKRQPILWRIVGLLIKEVPEWGFDVASRERSDLLLVMNVGRILLSAALVEERAGRHAEARDLLEGLLVALPIRLFSARFVGAYHRAGGGQRAGRRPAENESTGLGMVGSANGRFAACADDRRNPNSS